MKEQQCRVCQNTKPIEEFPKSRNHKSGYNTQCKCCEAEAKRRRYKSRKKPKPAVLPHENPSDTKICKQCGIEHNITMFYPDSAYKSGRRSICKDCVNGVWRIDGDKIQIENPQDERDLEQLRENFDYIFETYGKPKTHK